MSNNKNALLKLLVGSVLLFAFFWLVFRLLSGPILLGKDSFRIGRDSTWYPIDFRGNEKNMVGFADDLIEAIADTQGVKAYIFEVGPHAILDSLNIDRYEAVLSSLTPNIINQKHYVFSDPFYLVGPILVVNTNSNIHSYEDINGKIIGVERGDLEIYNIPQPPNVVIIPYETSAQALEKLDLKIIDGVILDALPAYVQVHGFYKGRLKVVTSPLNDRGLRLIAKNNPESQLLISRFNEGLKLVKEKGVYEELLKKWQLINMEID